jgi:putative inorganic carbon (HCO3(-)) transporter
MIWGITLIIASPYLLILPAMYIVYQTIKHKHLSVDNTWSAGLLLLYIWATIVGFINHSFPSIVAALVILVYFFISNYIQHRFQKLRDIERLLSSLFILSMGSALIAVLDKVGIINTEPAVWKFLFGIRSMVDIQEDYRVAGTFNNPNLAGTWYASMVLIGYYFFRRYMGVRKWLYAFGALLFFAVLMFTGSRGALFGLILGVTAYTYFRGHQKKMIFTLVSAFFVTAIMLWQPDWFPRGDILYSSIQDRLAIWKNALNMFMLQPLTGWGLLGIYYASPEIYQYLRVFHAHNTLLTVIVEMGLIGLGIFIWMQWNMFQYLFVLQRHACRLTPMLGGVLATVLGQGLFDFTIMSPQIGLLFIFCSSVILGLGKSYAAAPSLQKVNGMQTSRSKMNKYNAV